MALENKFKDETMAVKKILTYGTPSLREPSKDVHKISKKIQEIVKDLLDTLYSQNGVGLAAPQIGENYRIFVIDTSSGDEPLNPRVFINPKIIKKSGGFVSNEGCLSFPEVYINVRRYENVTIKAQDSHGRPFLLEAKNGELLAKAIQHEFDHLNGILFIDHTLNRFDTEKELNAKHLPPLNVDNLVDEPEIEAAIKAKCAGEKK